MNIASHILLATDFSAASQAAVAMAGELTRALAAKLTVLRVHGYPPEPPEAYVLPERLVLTKDLDTEAMEGLELLRSAELADIEGIVLAVAMDGFPSHAICDCAAKYGADLIVIGSHARIGVTHFFLGSVAEKVVKHAPCPVLVVPPGKQEAPVGVRTDRRGDSTSRYGYVTTECR